MRNCFSPSGNNVHKHRGEGIYIKEDLCSERRVWKEEQRKRVCACVCVYVCTGGVLYSLWCHLRKVLGPVKLSEWMECFFRRPRSTFFHRGTSVCLFLFQIHSIIPDCSKHSRTFQEPHIPFSTPARITTYHPPLTLTPAPTQISSFFFLSIIPHHRWTWPKKRPSLSLLAPCRGIRVTLDEGKPSYFKHTWLVLCAVIKKKKKWVSESRHNPPAADEAAPRKQPPLICLLWLDSWWDPGRRRHTWLHRCTEHIQL